VAKVVLRRRFWKIGFTWIYTVLPSVTISIFVIIGVSNALARNRDSKHACEGKRGKGTATCFYILVRKISIFLFLIIIGI
jgi:hypothetical protein